MARSRSPARPAGSAMAARFAIGHGQLDDRPAALTTEQLPGLVGGDRDQPRPETIGVLQGRELAPGDRPRRADGLVGEVEVAADDEADPGHVVVVGPHDPRERRFVARGGRRHRGREWVVEVARDRRHALQMLGHGSSDSPVTRECVSASRPCSGNSGSVVAESRPALSPDRGEEPGQPWCAVSWHAVVSARRPSRACPPPRSRPRSRPRSGLDGRCRVVRRRPPGR